MSPRHPDIQASESPERTINQAQLSSHSIVKSTTDKIKQGHYEELIKSQTLSH